MEAWLDEFVHALKMGFDEYKRLRQHSLPPTLLPSMPYLTIHGTFCVVRDRFRNKQNKASQTICLLRSSTQDGPYMYLSDAGWNSLRAVLGVPAYCGRVPFSKLRGPERVVLGRLHTCCRIISIAWGVVALVLLVVSLVKSCKSICL